MERSKFTRSDEALRIPLLKPLFDDVVECEELLDRSDTQFARRALVRAAFAFNEGYVYWLKEHMTRRLLAQDLDSGEHKLAKLVLLLDESYRPNRLGKLESEPNRIPFLNQCAFVLRTAAETLNYDAAAFFSDNGWNDMQRSLRVRHRITHPKNPLDLEIADLELLSISEGIRWLYNCVVELLNSTIGGSVEVVESEAVPEIQSGQIDD